MKEHEHVTPCIFPHAPYTTDAWIYQKARALVDLHGGILSTHLSESYTGNNTIQELYGMSPTEFVQTNGFLTPRTILAHSVWLSDSDIDLIAQSGAHVASCPTSEMKLASGVLRWDALQNAGITVSISTDGAASNNNLDMIDEMRTASLVHKVTNLDPTIVSAKEAVVASTIAGAKTIGKSDILGSIEVGKLADLTVIKRSLSYSLLPAYDPYSAVVYAANGNNVFATIVNGKVLYYDGKLTTIDEEKLRSDVDNIRTQVTEALKDE